MNPINFRCGQCCRPLGAIDLNENDGRCTLCRLESQPVANFVVVAIHSDRRIVAVEYCDDRRMADRVAYAWRGAKLNVEIREPAKAAALLT